MFTGLIQQRGTLARRLPRGPGYRLEILAEIGPLELGESIAVSGVCLSVVASSDRGFDVDVTSETASRTTLGRLAPSSQLNLERSLCLGDRLGGHWVLGHVDGVARVESVVASGNARRVVVRAPGSLGRFIAPKGSVSLDGVSLTVNEVRGGTFEVMLIPQTLELTNLEGMASGRELNLEVDVLARYAVHWLESQPEAFSLPALLSGTGAGS